MAFSVMKAMLKILPVIWAAPTSLVGLAILIPFGGGARFRWVQGALEVWGPGIEWMFKRFSPVGAQAMVIGHFVFGINPWVLTALRRHERVHVHQAEIFGPFFLPLYIGASLWLLMQGRDGYRSNPFEVQAYSIGGSGEWHLAEPEPANKSFPFWPVRIGSMVLVGSVGSFAFWFCSDDIFGSLLFFLNRFNRLR